MKIMITRILVCGLLVLAATPGYANLICSELSDVSWETSGGMVLFTLSFYNADIVESAPETGTMTPNEYGAFMVPGTNVYAFDIPPIPPESFFDVFIEIPLIDLPETAAEILPWNEFSAGQPCPADDHWDGSIYVTWTSPNGDCSKEIAQGSIQVCYMMDSSWIHVFTESSQPTTWSMAGPYCGLVPTLRGEDFIGHLEVLEPGWSGWIKIPSYSAAVVGDICPRILRLVSGDQTVDIVFNVEVCDCAVIPNEAKSWGNIKTLYR